MKEDFQDEEFKSNITNVEEFQNLLDIEGDVIVIFYNAKWCRKCKATKPKIARIKKEMADAKFYDVDVGFNKELAKFNDIKTIPRIQIIKDGEIKENFIFKTSKSVIDNIEKYS